MNLRSATLKYLGWCPGVSSAAKFLPNKDVDPVRIMSIIVMAVMILVSGFYSTNYVLASMGFPDTTGAEVINVDPILTAYNGELFITFNVKTYISGSASTRSSSIYSAQLSDDGRLADLVKVIDLGRVSLQSMDVTVDSNGRWFIAYYHEKFTETSLAGRSNLMVIYSDDRMNWSQPTAIIEAKPDPPYYPISIVSKGDDEIVVVFRDKNREWCSSIFVPGEDYSSPVKLPVNGQYLRAFVEEDGCLAVICVDRDDKSLRADTVNGLLFSMQSKDGSWSEPLTLSHDGVPLRGVYPTMLYCKEAGRYTLLMENSDPQPRFDTYTIVHSTDLEIWSRQIPFQVESGSSEHILDVSEPSMASQDGDKLAVAFTGRLYEVESIIAEELIRGTPGLYLTTSKDGENWSASVRIEKIIETEALESLKQEQRNNTSTISGILITTIFLVLTVKVFGFNIYSVR